MNHEPEPTSMRLDKWLWCARFFKTRSLAIAAIKSGKISVNDERPKASKMVQVNDALSLRKGPYKYDIQILKLVKTRVSAKQTELLYEETEQSVAAREMLAKQLKAEADMFPRTRGRPTKRDRRDLAKFKSRQ